MKNTNRTSESLKTYFHTKREDNTDYETLIFLSSSDVGVMRNNGRNGSRYAPRAIINQVQKFNNHLDSKNKALLIEVTNQLKEQKDFKLARLEMVDLIKDQLTTPSKYIHLGGGHDQIYPLLKAIDESSEFDNIVILNIDAHCDTRIDSNPNSGTPFRDFDSNGVKQFHLIQFGLQEFANSKSTLTKLQRGSEEKLFIDDISETSKGFTISPAGIFDQVPFKLTERTAVVFSLDCDGIDGSNMKAVSAVNPKGIPSDYVSKILQYFYNTFSTQKKFYGFYEFNPVYEDMSLYSTKVVSSIIYKILNFK